MESLRWQSAALALALAILAGCGKSGPEVAFVSGTVTLDGKPLDGATIIFTPTSGGRPSGAETNEEGYYELTYTEGVMGALPGKHTVTIRTFRESNPGENVKARPETLPAKYNAKTKLKKKVEAGQENDIDFNLDSEGQVLPPPGFRGAGA